MSRVLALLAIVALFILAGCGAVQATDETPRRGPLDVASEVLTETGRVLDATHLALRTLHTAAAERARAAATTAEEKHAAVDAVHAQYRPAWDAYEKTRTVYLAFVEVLRAAQEAEAAGRAPDTQQIAAAMIAVVLAVDALADAAAAVGVPVAGGDQ